MKERNYKSFNIKGPGPLSSGAPPGSVLSNEFLCFFHCLVRGIDSKNSMCKTNRIACAKLAMKKTKFAMHLTAESLASASTYVRVRVLLSSSRRYDTRHQHMSDSVLPEMRAVPYGAAIRELQA